MNNQVKNTHRGKQYRLASSWLVAIILSACQHQPKPLETTPNSSRNNPIPSESASLRALICEHAIRWQGQVVGDGHCVSLIKRCTDAPRTALWRPGRKVQGQALLPGTIIATFKGDTYPNVSGYHAAIYIEQTDEGIVVWDQWRGMPVHRRLIRWQNPGAPAANSGTVYRVVKAPN